MAKNTFLERNQNPYDKNRTQIIELFVKKSGDKLEQVVVEAERLCMKDGKSFERSLADALEKFKLH